MMSTLLALLTFGGVVCLHPPQVVVVRARFAAGEANREPKQCETVSRGPCEFIQHKLITS